MDSATLHGLLIVAVVSAVTVLVRVGPAWLFPPDKPTPPMMVYLGKVMPMAVIGLLIVYCLRNVKPVAYPYGLPELIGIAVTAVSYLIKRSTVLSILLGTVTYMVLVQYVFA